VQCKFHFADGFREVAEKCSIKLRCPHVSDSSFLTSGAAAAAAAATCSAETTSMLSGLTFGSKKELEKQFREEAEREKAKKREEKKLSKKQNKVSEVHPPLAPCICCMHVLTTTSSCRRARRTKKTNTERTDARTGTGHHQVRYIHEQLPRSSSISKDMPAGTLLVGLSHHRRTHASL